MIESRYWRAELKSDLAWLKNHRAYRRWTEKQQVLFERKLMLVAFQVRSLLERRKVNDGARSASVQVVRFKKMGSRPFTATGAGWPDERFDMDHGEPATLSALDLCNQLIHYYWMQTISEETSFAALLVFSDYQRHKWAYWIGIENLLKLFHVFADDSSAVTGAESKWDEKKQDFMVTRSWGPGESPPKSAEER